MLFWAYRIHRAMARDGAAAPMAGSPRGGEEAPAAAHRASAAPTSPTDGPRSAPRRATRRALLATIVAVVVLSTSWSALSPTGGSHAPVVAVVGGSVVDVSDECVRIVATSPDCRVLLSSAPGGSRPHDFRLELANIGAASRVTGLARGETLETHGRDANVVIRPGSGWPRWVNASLPAPPEADWSFMAIGDPQGHDWNLAAAGALASALGARFVLLLGDATASGEDHQFDRLSDALDAVDVPVYATPGNHDVKAGGTARFERLFGAADVAFDYGGTRFVLVDTSSQTFDGAAAARLRSQAGGRPAGARLVIATHTSPIDPRQGMGATYLEEGDAARLMAEAELAGADMVLAGHVHMFCSTATPGGVPLVITGGGGAVMEALDVPGAFHHVVRVRLGRDGVTAEPVPLSDVPCDTSGGGPVEVRGRAGERLALDVPALLALATDEGTWSFEDRFENVEGTGLYRCAPMGIIVTLVGGMRATDTLRVTARDGYLQTFSRANVFPDTAQRQAQGDMALAVSFDGLAVPSWEAGPRLVFTPQDGLHSNADAEATTDEAFRADPFSAGSRWVREVASVEVVPG